MKIIFVHLGEAPANHLWANINSLISRFKNFEIVLVSDRKHSELKVHPRVNFFMYKQSENTKRLLMNLKFESNFRNGFWHFTLERLIALSQYHQTNPYDSILHIESDVLLLNGFPVNAFDSLDKLCWLRAHEFGDIATLIYSPNAGESCWLSQEVESLIKNDYFLTDMKALMKIRETNPSRVITAPSMSHQMINELLKKNTAPKEIMKDLSALSPLFNGIFDPAAIGMWLTGCDPRNHYGFTRIFDTDEVLKSRPYIDPSLFNYHSNNSGTLTILVNGIEISIWCLHVHSKDLKLFNIGWESRMLELVNLSKSNKIRTQFDFVCLLKLVHSNYKNKTLIGFILYIPKLRRFREFLIQKKAKVKLIKNRLVI